MTNKMKGSIVVVIVCLVAAGIVLYLKYGHGPAVVQQPRDTIAATRPASQKATASSTTAATETWNPPAASQAFIDKVAEDHELDAQHKAELADFVARNTAYKEAGATRWGSEKWMKDPHYYESLDTATLAVECFAGSRFANGMGIYSSQPQYGLASLRIYHNGFAVLLERKDMWRGMLAAYDHLAVQIDPHTNLSEFIGAADTLAEMRRLYELPPLKEQVKGREKLFLAAQVRILKRFKHCLEAPDPKVGVMFFGEPIWIAESAMDLAKQIDPQRAAKIEAVINGLHFSEEQRKDELERNLELILKSFDGFPMDQEERK